MNMLDQNTVIYESGISVEKMPSGFLRFTKVGCKDYQDALNFINEYDDAGWEIIASNIRESDGEYIAKFSTDDYGYWDLITS